MLPITLALKQPLLDEDPDPVAFDGPACNAAANSYLQRFTVTYEYPVVFTRGLFEQTNPVFADTLSRNAPHQRHKFAVFIDDGLAGTAADRQGTIEAYAAAHAETLELVARPEYVRGGEQCKNDPALVERLQRRLVDLGIDRHSFVVAIGGGAVLDLIGYVAATVHRGIRHIRIPTTVLSQNDSGVGVKNGVNAFGQKNLLGTFVPPFAVLNDAAFLDDLAPREKRAGLAEAVKVALIRDPVFFRWLEANVGRLAKLEPDAIDHAVRRCAELHMAQIANGGDPFERGSARPLDFGHWSAHKLELMTKHALRHGEAVAIGIALDARYSVLCGMLAEGEDRRILALLQAIGLPTWDPALAARDSTGEVAFLRGLRDFKEHLGGELTITLLESAGRGVEVHVMDERLIMEAVDWLKQSAI